MNLNLPQSGRVVVIDDKPDESLPLVKVLSKDKISVTYFTGRREELPVQPFSDVRLVFLDIVLEGAEGTDDKTKLSIATGVIGQIIDKDNGPFILVAWTKHRELIKEMEGRLKEENYQPIVTDLQKYEFKDDKTGKYNYNLQKIGEKLKERLENLSIFEIFILWENIVQNSASSIVNEFSKLVEFNKDWNGKLKNIFYKLAEASAGRTLDINSSQEVLKNALFTFDGIFADTLEKNIHEEHYNEIDLSSRESGVEEGIKGKINSKLIIDGSGLGGFYPGNVYKIDENNYINEALNTSNIGEINEIKNMSIPIIVEVSPLCDFVQDKIKLSRIVKGFLCPIEVQIDGTAIKTYKKLKSNAYFLYISPVIEYNEKPYRLVIDFRYFSAKSIDENGNRLIFRLRKDILSDIQTKLSSHINRPGVLFIK